MFLTNMQLFNVNWWIEVLSIACGLLWCLWGIFVYYELMFGLSMICCLLNFLPDCKGDQRFHGNIYNIVFFVKNLFCFAYILIIPPKPFCTLFKCKCHYDIFRSHSTIWWCIHAVFVIYYWTALRLTHCSSGID